MKKIVAIPLVLFALFVLNGCVEEVQPENQIQQIDPVAEGVSGENEVEEVNINGEVEDEEIDLSEEVVRYDELTGREELTLDECETIEDDRLNTLCKNDYYAKEALINLDKSMCENISREYERNECVNKVAEFSR